MSLSTGTYTFCGDTFYVRLASNNKTVDIIGVDDAILSGGDDDFILYGYSGADTTFTDITLTEGNYGYGGAVRCSDVTVEMDGVTVEDNASSNGGAVYLDDCAGGGGLRLHPLMRLRLPLAALVAFALACTGGGGDDDPVGDPGGGDTASSSEQAPQILEFTANPMTVSDGADATFCALVTDPQGIDDLIGGSLKANGATLAAFSGAADEGSYSATVGFTALSEAYDVDADGQSGTLTVTASFSDQTGNTSTQDLELELELTCDGGDHLCTDVARD